MVYLSKEEISEITSSGIKFFQSIKEENNGRYLSWEHCYSTFAKYQGRCVSEIELDYLALHLSFYLASWGMYRGSSFLLWKDYKIHYDAIKELLNAKYTPLWAIKCSEYKNGEVLELLFLLVNNLKSIDAKIRWSAKQAICKSEPQTFRMF